MNDRKPPAPTFSIENLDFVYRPNFEGRKERYNDEGNRYFNAGLTSEMADILTRDGWNVKWTKPSAKHPNPEEHVPEAYLEVTVGFEFRPPTIIFIRDGRQQQVGENLVGLIDSMEFETIDVSIRGSHWNNDNGSGIKAYLKSFYGTVEMDDLDRKYNVAPVSESFEPEPEAF